MKKMVQLHRDQAPHRDHLVLGSDVFKTASTTEAFSASQGNEIQKVFKGKESSKPRSGSDIFKVLNQFDKAAFPLLPTPPASKKLTTRNILKPVILPSGDTKPGSLAPPVRPGHNNRLKSKSLHGGLPLDGSVFEQWSNSSSDRKDEDKFGVNRLVDAKKK